MQNNAAKIKLKNVKVVFFSPEDEGYGKSITIDCTDEAVKNQIVEWVKVNNIGKDNPGVAKIRPYTNPDTGTTTYQFVFKITDRTQYAGIDGLGKDDIGRGSIVDLIANAYPYNNKWSQGKDKTGQSASAIVVRSRGGSSDADLAELLGEMGEEPESEVKAEGVPF